MTTGMIAEARAWVSVLAKDDCTGEAAVVMRGLADALERAERCAEMTADRCPLCGSLVRVHTAAEGTCSYEPVAEKAIREALQADTAQIHGNPYKRLLALRKALRRGLGETS